MKFICRCAEEFADLNGLLAHYEVHGGVPKARVRDYKELLSCVGELLETEASVVYSNGAKYTSSWSESMSPATIRNRPPIRAQLGVLGSSLQAERGPS